MFRSLSSSALLAVVTATLVPLSAHAQQTEDALILPVQGFVTDLDDVALDGPTELTFRLYGAIAPDPDAGVSDAGEMTGVVHEETMTLSVESGLFFAYVGSSVALPAALFADDRDIALTVQVTGDPDELPPIPLGTAPYAAFADQCANAFNAEGIDNGALYSMPDDNVGVGTDAPRDTLEVNGNILLTGGAHTIGIEQSNAANNWDLTIQAGGPVGGHGNGRRGGTLYLRAGHENLSTGGDPCVSSNNHVRIYAGDNAIGQPWQCNAERNGNIELYAGHLQPLRMIVVGNSGNVGINTSDPQYRLHVNGSVAGVGAYQNVSDARFKSDVQPLTQALDKVLALRGVRYRYDPSAPETGGVDDRERLGFLAQEVNEVLPEAVTVGSDGVHRMAYGSIVPVLVEAVREQEAELDQSRAANVKLQEELAATRAKLLTLDDRLSRLEASASR